MYIYGEHQADPRKNRARIKLQRSVDLPEWAIREADTNPNFMIINTRTNTIYVPDGIKPRWEEIEPNLE